MSGAVGPGGPAGAFEAEAGGPRRMSLFDGDGAGVGAGAPAPSVPDTPAVPVPGGYGGARCPTAEPGPPGSAAPLCPASAAGGASGAPVTDDERLTRIALSRLAEPGDAVFAHWMRELGPTALWGALAAGRPLGRMRAERRARIARLLPTLDPTLDLARCQALGARFVCPGDAEWPSQLNDLGPQLPYGLWVRGVADLRAWALRSVALVGSRACTDYGAYLAGCLGADLAEHGWTVVSGAAFGVDGAAHRGALAARGATVAVLACGVDTAYPPRHTALLARIAEQGLLVAELAPGTPPNRNRFVLRNRVIAALTRGTVVVEAGLRSGALITARRARDLRRQVMAVPGPVTSELSAGTHRLLRDGAVLVTGAAEIAEQVGRLGADLAPEPPGPALPRDLLEPAAAEVLEAVPGGRGGTLAELSRATGDGPDRLLPRLQELTALGFLVREGDHWRPNRAPVDGRGLDRSGAGRENHPSASAYPHPPPTP